MQIISRAGAILSSPPGRFARFIAVLLPFLPLFPCLLAGGASAWAADSRVDRGRGPVVVAATVLDTAQMDVPDQEDVPGPARTSSQTDMPDASFAADPVIDANRATAEQLQTLRGIGPAMAARIIAERERHPFASLDDLARRVCGGGARRLRQWQEAGLVVSPRQPGGVQVRAVHGHRGHARSVGTRAADTQGTGLRGVNVQSTHAMGANALGANVQGIQAPGTPVPVGGATAHPNHISAHPLRHAEAAGHTIEVIQGHPRLPSRGTAGRATRTAKGQSGAGRSAVGRSSAERSAVGRSAAERSPAEQRAGNAVPARSRSTPTTDSRSVSRTRSQRTAESPCHTQRRARQRARSGKGSHVRRSTAPPLFEDRPLFDCRSIFDERSRLFERG